MHIIEGLLKFFSTALKNATFARFSEDHTLSSAEERVSWRSSDGKMGETPAWLNMNQAFKEMI